MKKSQGRSGRGVGERVESVEVLALESSLSLKKLRIAKVSWHHVTEEGSGGGGDVYPGVFQGGDKTSVVWGRQSKGWERDEQCAIMGYGDYVISDSVISGVYYVEGLGHNLFSVEHFCDLDLEVAFKKHSCYVRDVDGVELLKGNRGSNLYTISVEDMMKSSPICLLSKASKNKSWL
ncbi:hypothetical protein Tco_0612181 [Tanacetum coccineum]